MKLNETLSVREFRDVCDENDFREYIFLSENQIWDKVGSTIKTKLVFKIMLIAMNPNANCFRNEESYLCLERVKRVIVVNGQSAIGAVFAVVCGNLSNSDNDITYTIVAK